MTPEEFLALPLEQQIAFVSQPDLSEEDASNVEQAMVVANARNGDTSPVLVLVQNPGLKADTLARITLTFVDRFWAKGQRHMLALLDAYGQNESHGFGLLTGSIQDSNPIVKMLNKVSLRQRDLSEMPLPMGVRQQAAVERLMRRLLPYVDGWRAEGIEFDLKRAAATARGMGPWVSLQEHLNSALRRSYSAHVQPAALYMVFMERLTDIIGEQDGRMRISRAPAFWALVLDLAWDRLLPEGEPG